MEHIVVWEQFNHTELPAGWVIHHINRIKDDNRIGNLRAMTSREHTGLHNSEREVSEITRRKIGNAVRQRLADPENHPRYKAVDAAMMRREILGGAQVKETCAKYGISKTTYYRKIKEYNNGEF